MRQYFFVVTLVVLIAFVGSAQPTVTEEFLSYNPSEEVIPASPTTTSLAKYGDVPVSLYTGSPSISIPLYTVQQERISIPISLSYNASGIKVSQQSSWVGLGWDLKAGGVISRSVRGIPDDVKYVNQWWKNNANSTGGQTFEGNAGYLYRAQVINQLCTNAIDDENNLDLMAISEGWEDSEPDLFNFSFGEYSGKFFFNDQGIPVVTSENDLKIEYDLVETLPASPTVSFPYQDHLQDLDDITKLPYHGGISEFRITTPDGLVYTFNQRELGLSKSYENLLTGSSSTCNVYDNLNNRIQSIPNVGGPYDHVGQGQPANAFISSWKLSSISTTDAHEIVHFVYTDEIHFDVSQSSFRDVWHNDVPLPYSETKSSINFTKIFTKRLAEVQSQHEIIKFIANDLREDIHIPHFDLLTGTYEKPKALSSIEITTTNGALLKKFNLTQSYFSSNEFANCSFTNTLHPVLEVSVKRLKLDNITELSSAESLPPYVFSYNSVPLPSRYSMEQDFWGYYNNNNSTSLYPTVYVYPDDKNNSMHRGVFSNYPRNQYTGQQYILTGADRTPNNLVNQAGLIQSIVYPLGGSTSLEFESNIFLLDGQEYLGGGLRISKTIDHDGSNGNQDLIKEYHYLDSSAGLSSGKIIALPQFAYGTPLSDGSNLNRMRRFTKAVNGLETTFGSYVGYQFVQITQPGNGYIHKEFAIPADYHTELADCDNGNNCIYQRPASLQYLTTGTDERPFAPLPNYDWRRGQLLNTIVFNEQNVPVKKEYLEYEIGNHQTLYGIKVQAKLNVYSSSDDLIHFVHTYSKYSQVSGWSRLKEKIIENFNEDGYYY